MAPITIYILGATTKVSPYLIPSVLSIDMIDCACPCASKKIIKQITTLYFFV